MIRHDTLPILKYIHASQSENDIRTGIKLKKIENHGSKLREIRKGPTHLSQHSAKALTITLSNEYRKTK